jgi:hypothetical protein
MRSWSLNQWGPRAFGRSIRDTKFPSRFRAPTNMPRYDGDTNPSVWLEDYRLACHAGGATDDLFVIKNLPLYLSDSAHTWLCGSEAPVPLGAARERTVRWFSQAGGAA